MRKRIKKIACVILAVLVLSIASIAIISANNHNLSFAVENGWVKKDGNWYYYQDGSAKRGWILYNDGYYYLGSDGIMVTGWKLITYHKIDYWFYFAKATDNFAGYVEGQMLIGKHKIDNVEYYFCEKNNQPEGFTKGALYENVTYNNVSYDKNGRVKKAINYNTSSLPARYTNEWMGKIYNRINNITSSSNNTLSFVHITDMHFSANRGYSSLLIRKINEKLNNKYKFVFNNGDYCQLNGDLPIINIDKQNFINFTKSLTDNGIKVYSGRGNHDFNVTNSKTKEFVSLPQSEVYSVIRGTLSIPDSQIMSNRLNYYFDDTVHKVRYIHLDLFDGMRCDNAMMTWLLDKVTNVDSYYFVIFTHSPVDSAIPSNKSTRYVVKNTTIIHDLEAAINNRRAFKYNNKTYDFTNTGNAVLLHLSGHGHEDVVTITDKVLSVDTTSDATYNDDKDKNDNLLVTREGGKTSEQAFDIITIDFNNHKIYSTRVGAGSNREWKFQVNTRTVTQTPSSSNYLNSGSSTNGSSSNSGNSSSSNNSNGNAESSNSESSNQSNQNSQGSQSTDQGTEHNDGSTDITGPGAQIDDDSAEGNSLNSSNPEDDASREAIDKMLEAEEEKATAKQNTIFSGRGIIIFACVMLSIVLIGLALFIKTR